jgi:shikimate kinase
VKNIVLIGMPSAGKSTVGVVVAKNLGMSFVDTDVLLQTMQGRLLQDIINEDGIENFLKIEENTIISLDCKNTVIATGGSAIYSEQAMNHLKQNGIVIYLDIDLEVVNKRLNNIKTRGVVLGPSQTLEQVYATRKPLYERYADITIDCSKYSIDTTINTIHQKLDSLS